MSCRLAVSRRQLRVLGLLVSTLLALPTVAQRGGGRSGTLETWTGALTTAETHLRAGRYDAAEKAVDSVLPAMLERLLPGEDSNAFLALALFLRAGAEAGQGREDDAVWSWHAAQCLDPEMRAKPLPDYGAATGVLQAHRLRHADEIPASEPSLPEGWSVDEYLPPLPVRVPAPDVHWSRWSGGGVRLSVVVRADGTPTAPVLEGSREAKPAQIYRQIEALRGWRFRPATYRGQPVAVAIPLVDLGTPLSSLLTWVRDEELQPIHDLLLAGDWSAAEATATQRIRRRLETSGPEKDPTADFVFRALARAGLGRQEDALVDLRVGESLSSAVPPQLAAYGEPGRWLWRHHARCVTPGLLGSSRCEAVDPLSDPGVTPPRPLRLPYLFGSDGAADERLVVRLLVGTDGRVEEARMLAGSGLEVAPPALRAVRSWRFEPATRDGVPVPSIYDTAVHLPAEARQAEASGQPVERWRHRLEAVEGRLGKASWEVALQEASRLQADLETGLARGGSDLLAQTLAARALAEAALGSQPGAEDGLLAAAVWHWRVAQNLAPELRYRDLAGYGAAGAALAGHLLRDDPAVEVTVSAGPVPVPAADGPASRSEPAALHSVDPEPQPVPPGSGVAEVEVVVDSEGSPRSPRLRVGYGPARLSAALEALRQWRFEPPADGPVRRLVVLRTGRGLPPYQVLNPRLGAMVRAAVRAIDDDPSGAACLWESAQGVEPRVTEVDLDELADKPRVRQFLRSHLLAPRARWTWPSNTREAVPARVGGDVEPPRKLRAPQPQYTRAARTARTQGVVIVQAVIGVDGRVHRARVLRGLPNGMSEVTAATICAWTFEPAILDGEPVEVSYNLTVSFTLQ